MYVYHKKYQAKKVIVIYPKNDPFFDCEIMRTDDNVIVAINCFDILDDTNNAITRLFSLIIPNETSD